MIDPVSIFAAVTGGLQLTLALKTYMEDRKRRKQQEHQQHNAPAGTICITAPAAISHHYYLHYYGPPYYYQQAAGSNLMYYNTCFLLLRPVQANSASPNYHSRSLPSGNGNDPARARVIDITQPAPQLTNEEDGLNLHASSRASFHHEIITRECTNVTHVGSTSRDIPHPPSPHHAYRQLPPNGYPTMNHPPHMNPPPPPPPPPGYPPMNHPPPGYPHMNYPPPPPPLGYPPMNHPPPPPPPGYPHMNHPPPPPPPPPPGYPHMNHPPPPGYDPRFCQWLGPSYNVELAKPQEAPFLEPLHHMCAPRTINTGIHHGYNLQNAYGNLLKLFQDGCLSESLETIAVVNWTKGIIYCFEESQEGVYYQNYMITQCDVMRFAYHFKSLEVFSGEVHEGKLQRCNKNIEVLETPSNGHLMGEWSVGNDFNECILVEILGGAVFGIICSLFQTLSQVSVDVQVVRNLHLDWSVCVHTHDTNKTNETMLFSVFSFNEKSWWRKNIILKDNVHCGCMV